MAGKRYSAGAIFLQVVPVFANVQRAIEDEAKNIDRALGDRMEESGDKAGKRAGKAASKSMNEELKKGGSSFERDFKAQIEGMQRSLDGVNANRMSNSIRKEVAAVKREMAALGDIDLTIDGNFTQVNTKLVALEARLAALRAQSKLVYRADFDDVLRGVAKVKAAVETINPTIDLDVDTTPAERKLSGFERSIKRTMGKAASHIDGSVNKELRRLHAELDYLGRLRVNIDIGAGQLKREVAEILAELDHLSKKSPEVDVRFEAGRAYAELKSWYAAVERADRQKIEIKADFDARNARRGLRGLSGDGDNAANSFRSFNLVLLAAASVGPALIPILGALAGGLLAIGPAAAVAAFGLGAVIVGFSGISDAVSALQAKQDQAAMSGQAAARQEASNARAVADARRSAADAIEAALDRQKDAQEAYRDSITDVKDAEQALAEARAAAKGQGDDIGDRIKDNQLGQDQGLLDVFNSTVNYNAVMADGSATNAEKEQARIEMEQAKRALEELREEAKELAKEKKKWDKEGVNGTEEVQSAQENLNDAIDAQKDAYENLRDAAEGVDEARADGARQVADALRAQSDAMADISSQQAKVDAAFDKLGPAGQKFALFIQGLKSDFRDFRDEVQGVMLPQVQDAIESFFGSKSGSIARDALVGLADSFGRFAKALSTSFQGTAWTGFFTMLRDVGPAIQDAYGTAFIKLFEALASILTTAAPFALEFAEGFAGMMTAFADWAKSKKGAEGITKFMDWAKKVGPDVIAFIGSFVSALVAVVVAMAPWGDIVLKGLTGFMDIISGMDPQVLAGILTALTVVLVASQVAYALMNIAKAGAALLASTLGIWVFAIAGIALALVYLYNTNEDFREFIDKAWKEISAVLKQAWEDTIKPALEEMMDALMELWKEVIQPFIAWLGPILLWLIKKLIPLLAKAWSVQIRIIAFVIKNILVPAIKIVAKFFVWLWKNVLKPTWNAIRDAAVWLWKKVLKPAFEGMKDDWDKLMTGIKWVWENVLKPTWDYITDTALPALKGAFRTAVEAIKKIWDGLKKVVGAPIKFIIDTIINKGLIAGFNKVAGWVGQEGLDDLPIPASLQQYKTGGVLPGYTPGRDVHKYVSPTGGRLELSGGEAIMRPEWTAAMGPNYVNQMNALARSGGVNGIRKAMSGSYWMGGVLPLSGASVDYHESGYGFYAADMNYPGYADYGKAILAYKAGVARAFDYGSDTSYGRGVAIDHGGSTSVYAHMSAIVQSIIGKTVAAGTRIGSVGDYGNTGNPPTSHLHFELRPGGFPSLPYTTGPSGGDAPSGGGEKKHRTIPGWLMDTIKNPLAAVKGWITGAASKASGAINDSPMWNSMKDVPLRLGKKVTDKVWDVIPGWAKTAAGWAGDAAGWAVGGVKNAGQAVADGVGNVAGGVADGVGAVGNFLGLAEGGILPYNGTMMYDNGGYLPPGLTTVMNLTGKPEPVFTDGQWQDVAGGAAGGTIHYEPHFEGSDLTASDVAGDLNFTFRKIKRGGKYAGVADQ